MAAAAGALISFGANAEISIKNTMTHVPGEMLVKVRDQGGMKAQSVLADALVKGLGADAILAMDPLKTDGSLFKIRIKEDRKLGQAISALENNPAIKYAEPNYIYTAQEAGEAGVPNDPDFERLWGIRNTGQADSNGQVGTPGADVNVVPVWAEGITGSRSVLVAVIDTGVDWNHPDLKDNIYTNPGEAGSKANNNRDDDGNGFIDDVHGWNFNAKNKESSDDHDHGTHCAGTIGALGDDGRGVVGVNWQVSILPVKFLSAGGSGSLADAVESINYATLMKANIMSNSWGGGGFSEAMKESIEKARDAGILFVAAAGNNSSDSDSTPMYPASYQVENVVSVAALDNQDKLASFSNWGKNTVHVAAPGVRILSTTKDGQYDTFSGTSMATPHVSGVAGLLLSANRGMSYAEVKTRLITTSDPVRALRRSVVAHGRVNTYNAVHGIVPPSDEPDESLWQDVDFTAESEHPYANGVDKTFEISHPGAKYIRVHFSRVELEAGYDKVNLVDGNREVAESLSGNYSDYTSDYVQGSSATLTFTTDSSVVGWGFKVDKIQVILE